MEIFLALVVLIAGFFQLLDAIQGLCLIVTGGWRLSARVVRWVASGGCGVAMARGLEYLLPRPPRMTALAVVLWCTFAALAAWTAVQWFRQAAGSPVRLAVAFASCVFLPPLGLGWLMSGSGRPARRLPGTRVSASHHPRGRTRLP